MKSLIAIASSLVAVNAMTSIRTPIDEVVTVEKSGESDAATYLSIGASPAFAGTPPLSNHGGGGTMTGTIPIYVIYYGDNFSGSQAQYRNVLNAVLSNLGASSSTTSTLTASGVNFFSVARNFANVGYPSFSSSNTRQVSSYPRGRSLNDGTVQQIVTDAINGGLPSSTNAIYIVAGDSSVSASMGGGSYGRSWCGYHGNYSNRKYAYIGTGSGNCAWGTLSSGSTVYQPAQGGYVDGFVSVALHEITEAATDPYLNAWFSSWDGSENADMCNWRLRRADVVPSDSSKYYNMYSGGYYLVVQQNYYQSGTTKPSSCPQYSYSS